MAAFFSTRAMIMLSKANLPNPTVQVPPWPLLNESTGGMLYPSPVSGVSLSPLHCYLPSGTDFEDADDSEDVVLNHDCDSPVDCYSCDEFRIYEFKVRRCSRGRSHDWTECPFAHPGEKARRRDPRKYHYSGTACPDFRKGSCKRGDSCEFAHGVFECWLHPSRYRTQPCKDGTACRRRVCFFAHTPQQLRVLPPQQQQSPRGAAAMADSYDGSPLRQVMEIGSCYASKSPFAAAAASPTSTLISPPLSPPSDSPPLSPVSPSIRLPSAASGSVNEVLASLRQLQLSKVKSAPASWVMQFGLSPRGSNLRPAFSSLPSTPTAPATSVAWLDEWDRGRIAEEPMERVESGRDLRTRMYEKLSKENAIDRAEAAAAAPDVEWVSELVM